MNQLALTGVLMDSGVTGWCHPGRQLTVSPYFYLKKLMTFLVVALYN